MKKVLFILLALLGMGAVVVAFPRAVDREARQVSESDSSPAPHVLAGADGSLEVPRSPSATPECLPDEQAELAWRVVWSTGTSATLGPAAAWSASTEQTRHTDQGRLHARVLSRDADGALLLARFVDFTSSERPTWNNGARAPFLFRLDAQCELAGYAQHTLTLPAHARAQQALLTTLTWRWTQEPEESVNENGYGVAQHVFVAAQNGDQVLAQRAVRRYDAFWNGEDAQRPIESLFSFDVEPGSWFVRADGREVLTWGAGQIQRTLSANRIGFEEGALANASDNVDDYRWVNHLPQRFSARRSPREVTQDDLEYRARVQHRDAADAVSWFMDELEMDRPYVELIPELGLWLEARPDQTEEFVHLLASAGLPTQTINAMYMALGLARTAESRMWLETILDDDTAPPMDRVRAMHNLMDRDDVGMHQAEEFARRALAYRSAETNEDRFMGRQAIMALGAFATMQENPEIVALAKSVNNAALEAADTAEALRPVIGSMANIGDPESLEYVERFTLDPRYDVRMATARIIRRMDPEDTERFLVDWMTREPSVFVRGEVWNTHARQLHDANVPLSEALRPIAVHHLREGNLPISAVSTLVRLLGPSAEEDEDVRSVLIATGRTDHDGRSGIRRQVVRWLDIEGVQEVYR